MQVAWKYCSVCNMFSWELKLFCLLRRSHHSLRVVSKLTRDAALPITTKLAVEPLQTKLVFACHPRFQFFFLFASGRAHQIHIFNFPLSSLRLVPPHSCSVVGRIKTKRRCVPGDLVGNGCGGLEPQPPEALRLATLLTDLAYYFKTHRSRIAGRIWGKRRTRSEEEWVTRCEGSQEVNLISGVLRDDPYASSIPKTRSCGLRGLQGPITDMSSEVG